MKGNFKRKNLLQYILHRCKYTFFHHQDFRTFYSVQWAMHQETVKIEDHSVYVSALPKLWPMNRCSPSLGSVVQDLPHVVFQVSVMWPKRYPKDTLFHLECRKVWTLQKRDLIVGQKVSKWTLKFLVSKIKFVLLMHIRIMIQMNIKYRMKNITFWNLYQLVVKR